MGFFDKIKNAVNTATKKVGDFAKKTASDLKSLNEKTKLENNKEQATATENKECVANNNQPQTKEYLDNHIKSMYCKPTKQELKDELKLLHEIGAIDNDNIYIGGVVNFETKATALGSFFKSNKDKNFLSYNNGVFYCSYFNHEEKFMVYKYFLKSDVGEVDIHKELMENKLIVTGKDGFPLLTIDVTDNAKMLGAFEQLLK